MVHWTTHINLPVVPHKAVAEVSRIRNLKERLVVVNHGWQSEVDQQMVEVSSLSLSVFLSFSDYLPTYLPIYLCNLSIYLPTYLSTYLSTYVSIYLSLSLCVCLSIYLSICKLENEAILRDLLNF